MSPLSPADRRPLIRIFTEIREIVDVLESYALEVAESGEPRERHEELVVIRESLGRIVSALNELTGQERQGTDLPP